MEFDRIYAEVDLGRIEENMKAMKEHLRLGTKMYGVVKTDAYGHGAVPVARTIDRFVCGYAVATVDEGLKLRRHGIEKEILCLGPVSAGRYQECLENDISLPMFEYRRAKELSDAAVAEGKTAKIHIAVDTGMSRIGLFPDEGSVETVKEIAELPALRIAGMFTHFARADEADKTKAGEQYRRFHAFCDAVKAAGVEVPVCHCSNSAGIVELPDFNMDAVRAGITIYGLYPSDEVKQDIISNQFFPDPCLRNITILHQAAALREHPQCIQTFHQTLFKGSRCRRVCQISCQIIYDPCHICRGLPGKAVAVLKAHTLLPILS